MIITDAIIKVTKIVVLLCTSVLLFNLKVKQPPLQFNWHYSLPEESYYPPSFNGSGRNQENHFPNINEERLSGNIFLTQSLFVKWQFWTMTADNDHHWIYHQEKFIFSVSRSRGIFTLAALKLCLPGTRCSIKGAFLGLSQFKDYKQERCTTLSPKLHFWQSVPEHRRKNVRTFWQAVGIREEEKNNVKNKESNKAISAQNWRKDEISLWPFWLGRNLLHSNFVSFYFYLALFTQHRGMQRNSSNKQLFKRKGKKARVKERTKNAENYCTT